MADAAAWSKVREARRPGTLRRARIAETRCRSWCEPCKAPERGCESREAPGTPDTLTLEQRRGSYSNSICHMCRPMVGTRMRQWGGERTQALGSGDPELWFCICPKYLYDIGQVTEFNSSGALACQVRRVGPSDPGLLIVSCQPVTEILYPSCHLPVSKRNAVTKPGTCLWVPSFFPLRIYCSLQAILWPSTGEVCSRSRHSAIPFRPGRSSTSLKKPI